MALSATSDFRWSIERGNRWSIELSNERLKEKFSKRKKSINLITLFLIDWIKFKKKNNDKYCSFYWFFDSLISFQIFIQVSRWRSAREKSANCFIQRWNDDIIFNCTERKDKFIVKFNLFRPPIMYCILHVETKS